MLSIEGISRALTVFEGLGSVPEYKVVPPSHQLHVRTKSVSTIRPVVVAGILRGIRFTPEVYDSFIDLQDKIHSGIGRRRQIVSMGTHDLDSVQGPFVYDAVPRAGGFSFIPLNRTQEVDGEGMLELLESDLKLRKFLHLIRDSPLFPVILDSQKRVMSVPPIINSEHSKISLKTRNVFVDVTATDLTKASLALNTLLADFVQYCDGGIEAVQVIYDDNDKPSEIFPKFESRQETVSVAYINGCIGQVNLDASEMSRLLTKMSLSAEPADISGNAIRVTIPAMRSDIFHACDIMEDVAIAYGFNRIPKTIPHVQCFGSPNALNKLSDAVRGEMSRVGFTEIATLTLCSHAENFGLLRIEDPGNEAVVLANPKTVEYEVVHSRLAPQMLKTLACNKSHALPLRLFQVSDTVRLDPLRDTGARNERHLSVAFASNASSGFELIHGVLDRVMLVLEATPRHFSLEVALGPRKASTKLAYSIIPSKHEMFFPERQADILLYLENGTNLTIGSFGILHPQVLRNFDLATNVVVSFLEINIEPFL